MRLVELRQVAPADLVPAKRNPNKMDGTRYAHLRDGIKREGFLQPILARQLPGSPAVEIIDGHHRAQAAVELGLEGVACWVVEATDEEAARLAISLNRLRGELDLSEVAGIFAELADAGVDLELLEATGFSQEQVDTLIAAAQDEADEVAPDMGAMPDAAEDGQANDKPFVLEIPFGDKKEFQKAKRGLKRAAGTGNELSVGLMRLLGEEEVDHAQ